MPFFPPPFQLDVMSDFSKNKYGMESHCKEYRLVAWPSEGFMLNPLKGEQSERICRLR